MLNGFCRRGYPLSVSYSTSMLEKYIAQRIEDTNKKKGHVIFVCDNHKLGDPEIGSPYPLHCMNGTEEAKIIPPLRKYLKSSKIIFKSTLSIFYRTELSEVLEQLKSSEIEVTGVFTDICVLFAVYELRIRGFKVFISDKGVLPLDPAKNLQYLDYFHTRLGAQIELH